MIIIEDKKPKKETWTLEKAKQDYRNKHPFRFRVKRKCNNCVFHEEDAVGNVGCPIKETYILFKGLNAKLCKYYTEGGDRF